MKVSILIAYYNRPKQLNRTLWLYDHQTYPDVEVVIVDDGSTTHLERGTLIRPLGSAPRSPNTALRYAYSQCSGDFIIIGGPEIMAPMNAVETMLAKGDMSRRNVPILYYLAWNHHLYTVNWQADLNNLKQLHDFGVVAGEHGYTNFDSPHMFNHAGFSGATREVWEKMDPFLLDTEDWGRTDSYWHEKEMAMSLLPHHLPEIEVYHQWHEIIHGGNIPQYSHKIKQIRKAQMED